MSAREDGAGRELGYAVSRTRHEDLTWMAETGESLTGAARRLGLNRAALDRWARRHAPELLVQLTARDPHDWNSRTGGGNQWKAAS